MMFRRWKPCLMPSWSSDPIRPCDATSICVPMQATLALPRWRLLRSMATFLISKDEDKRLTNSGATPRKRQSAGSSKWHIVGSTDSENCWCDMKSLTAAFWRLTTWPHPSWHSERSVRRKHYLRISYKATRGCRVVKSTPIRFFSWHSDNSANFARTHSSASRCALPLPRGHPLFTETWLGPA